MRNLIGSLVNSVVGFATYARNTSMAIAFAWLQFLLQWTRVDLQVISSRIVQHGSEGDKSI